MRDLFFLAFLPYLIYLIFKRPFVGAALWIWSSLFIPDVWAWGIATVVRFNFTVVMVSILSYLLYSHKEKLAWSWTATFVLAFYIWFSISSALAISNTEIPFQWWDTLTRIIALFFFCQLVLTRKLHWDVFIWAMMLALGGYGAVEAVKYLLSGFNHSIVGIPWSPLSDRNLLAVGLNMMIPMAIYLRSQTRSMVLRMGLLAIILLLPIAVIGTFSRGGLVTLACLAILYLLGSGRRFLPVAAALAITAYGLSYVVTDEYVDRAQTIQTANEDDSFVGRTSAWKLSLYIALDRPFFGGGPLAVETPDVWPWYEAVYDPDQYWRTGSSYEMATRAAHSVYFQVLGDTGFGGLALYLLMLGSALAMTRHIVRVGQVTANGSLVHLGRALFLALAAFLIGGAALGMAYLDITFALLGLIAAAGARCRLPATDSKTAVPSRIQRAKPGLG